MQKYTIVLIVKSIFVIVLISITKSSFAQKEEYLYSNDRYISDSIMSNLNYGVYLTHQEFFNCSPSISTTFEIEVRPPNYKRSTYFLPPSVLNVLDTSSNKMKRYRRSFWGAFDDVDLYLMKDFVIYKLDYSGRFNLCKSTKWKQQITGNYERISEITNRMVVTFKIIDFKTNEWYSYSKKGMKQLLMLNDKSLYDKFKLEKRKKNKVGRYLKLLNGIKVDAW